MRCLAAIVFIGELFLVNRLRAASIIRNSSPSANPASVFFAVASIRWIASLQKTPAASV